ncbi:MAG: hypothetical protein ACR2GE_09040 [Pseudonocardia sp.]
MTDLREATRHTVNLAILDGNEVVYLEIVHGPDRRWSRPGSAAAGRCTPPGALAGRQRRRRAVGVGLEQPDERRVVPAVRTAALTVSRALAARVG